MNREIKFRAWDGERTLYFPQVGYDLVFTYHGPVITVSGRAWTFDNYSKLELMQYTGLKDKNGKEIYEGDIIRAEYDGLYEPDISLGSVIYDTLFGFMLDIGSRSIAFSEFDTDEFEVIGNMFENPELLEDEF